MMSNQSTRVAHVLGELKYSGAEVMLSSGANQLGADGSFIISTGETEGEYAAKLSSVGYTIKHIAFSKSLSFFKSFYSLLRVENPELVHIHTERASAWLALVARLSGVPVVRTIHNDFKFNGFLRFRRICSRQFARAIGVTHVSCSRKVAENEYRRFGLGSRVIDNWIDFNRIARNETVDKFEVRRNLALSQEAFLTISIANEAPAKNLMALFEAIGKLGQDYEHIHVGYASDHLRRGAAYFAADRVKFCGVQPEIGDLLAASDAFVCSSTLEGGPLVLMEAAAAGIPCVTTRVGVADEFGGCKGMVFTDPSSYSIAEGVRKIASLSPEEIKQASTSLSSFARSRFSPDIGATSYAELYAASDYN
jgi:glycosyltransferase involved in cell wall biosynthesis